MTRAGRSRIRRNGVSNLVRLVATVPIFLVLTPYMVRNLGEEAYGAWALVSATVAATALGDLGIGGALIRYVAFDDSRADGQLNTLVNTAAVIYLGIAAAMMLLGWLLHPWLLSGFFRVPAELFPELRVLFLGSLAAVLVNFVGSAYYSVLLGVQRYTTSNVIGILGTVVYAGAVFAVLGAGGGVAGLAVAPWAQTVVTAAGHVVALRRYAPGLRVQPSAFRAGKARELVGFSTRAFVGQISEYADQQMDKLILGYAVGSVEVGVYHVAADVARRLRAVPIALLNPVLPAASELAGREEHGRLAQTLRSAIRHAWAVGVLICAGTLVFADRFMEVWLGSGYSASNVAAGAQVLRILAVALFLNVLTAPYTYVMLAVGEPHVLARSALLHLTLNVGLSLAWVGRWGMQGVAFATLVATVAGLAYLVLVCNRRLGERSAEHVRLAVGPVLAAVAAAVVDALVLGGRPVARSVAGFAVGVALFTAAYVLCLALPRVLRAKERQVILAAARRLGLRERLGSFRAWRWGLGVRVESRGTADDGGRAETEPGW